MDGPIRLQRRRVVEVQQGERRPAGVQGQDAEQINGVGEQRPLAQRLPARLFRQARSPH